MAQRGSGRRWWWAGAGVLALLGTVMVPGAAQAHPFGAPQTVAVAVEAGRPGVIAVRWRVGGTDDLTLLGVALGILPQDRVLLDGAVFYRAADAAAIGPSPRFAAYLTERITVAGDGAGCAGVVEPPADLTGDGVTIRYTCPRAVGKAAVRVRMLTDLNPAYQTFASGPGGQRAVYRTGAESHDWVLGSVPATGNALRLGAAGGGALVVAAVAWGARRRWRRR